MTLNYQPVTSSNIAAVGYDAEKKDLGVRFVNGSEYIYADVPEEVYDGLVSASSVGSAFANDVKGVYSYRRIA